MHQPQPWPVNHAARHKRRLRKAQPAQKAQPDANLRKLSKHGLSKLVAPPSTRERPRPADAESCLIRPESCGEIFCGQKRWEPRSIRTTTALSKVAPRAMRGGLSLSIALRLARAVRTASSGLLPQRLWAWSATGVLSLGCAERGRCDQMNQRRVAKMLSTRRGTTIGVAGGNPAQPGTETRFWACHALASRPLLGMERRDGRKATAVLGSGCQYWLRPWPKDGARPNRRWTSQRRQACRPSPKASERTSWTPANWWTLRGDRGAPRRSARPPCAPSPPLPATRTLGLGSQDVELIYPPLPSALAPWCVKFVGFAGRLPAPARWLRHRHCKSNDGILEKVEQQ